MEEKEELELDLLELLFEIWKRKKLIIAAILVFAAASFAVTSFLITPMYASTTSLYVLNQQDGNQLTSSDMSVSSSLTSDFEILIASEVVLDQVIRRTGLEMTSAEVSRQVSVNNPNGTRFLKITATHEDPQMAKAISDAIADISSEQIVALMGIDKVNVVDYGKLPTRPSSPNLKRNLVLGSAAGFLLSVGFVLVVHLMDDSIKSPEEAERCLETSVLGVVPLREDAPSSTDSRSKALKRFLKRRR